MAIGEGVSNLSDVILALPPEIWERAEGFIVILKAIGVLALIYFVYIIGMGILSFRRARKLKQIEDKIALIDKKLDKLLKKKK
ncbi:hypothetical protein KAT36_03775 [Candidatus Pacearchaeota archaeon]|nr:hypothetical protein [Candidatus Pacearchaeota archaeon]